ncbi:MAG: TasA family protein [Limosilactobacillus sp.]
MKKKILALCLVIALAATAVIGGTLAYFTDDDEATNTFTVGNVKIDLTEPSWEEGVTVEDVYPGQALDKDPIVTNEGNNPCFVRVKVEGLDCLKETGASVIALRHLVDDEYADGYNDAAWTYNEEDGYYYYNEVLNPGDTTPSLFDQIVIPTDLENLEEEDVELDEENPDQVEEIPDPEFEVVVKAEAVQSQGCDAEDVDDIIAWFAEVMG